MIHHISIAAEHPQQVAEVLAEIFGGFTAPYPANPGTWMAFAGDAHGTMLEVHPLGTEMVLAGRDAPIEYRTSSAPSRYSPTHAAISVECSQADIEKIAEREGWCVRRCSRGPFDVVEVWLENSVMIEFSPPEMTQQYLDAMEPQRLAAYMKSAAS